MIETAENLANEYGVSREAADAYAAMTADRPYSPARTPQQATAELSRSAGSHFDPTVVEALLAVLGLADQSVLDAA